MAGTEKMATLCKQEKDMDMDTMDNQGIAEISAQRTRPFMKTMLPLSLCIMLLGLSGCMSLPAPTPIVQQPMTTTTPPLQPPPGNGTIFQAGTYDRPLFEDR